MASFSDISATALTAPRGQPLCRGQPSTLLEDKARTRTSAVLGEIPGCGPGPALSWLPRLTTAGPLRGSKRVAGGSSHSITAWVPLRNSLGNKTRPFPFTAPKCVSLTAYFLERLHDSCEGQSHSMKTAEIAAVGAQVMPFFLCLIWLISRSPKS